MAPRDAAQEVTRRLALTPAEGGARAAAPTLAETKEAAVEQGNGLYAQHRYEEAVAAYEQALKLLGRNKEARLAEQQRDAALRKM